MTAGSPLTPPILHPFLLFLSPALSGFRYGFRVRFTHAVLIYLLHSPSRRHRREGGGGPLAPLGRPLRAAWSHGYNLAKFALLYKTLLVILRGRTNSDGGWRGRPERNWHAAVAGAAGGFLVWGDGSEANVQILLYLFGRVALACYRAARVGAGKACADSAASACSPYAVRVSPPVSARAASAAIWGAVMYLFERWPQHLQRGLRSSMNEIYRADDTLRD